MRTRLLTYVGLLVTVLAAVGPMLGQMYPETALPLALAGVAAAALGKALTRFDSHPALTTGAAVVAVCAAVSPLLGLDYPQASGLLLIVAAGVAALCKGAFGVEVNVEVPPQTGRGQSGQIRLSALLALLTLCLSLPFVLTGCPRSSSQDAAAQIRPRAERAVKTVEHLAGDFEMVGDVTRELRAGGLVSDDGARVIAQLTLEANNILAEATEQALSYQSLDEFARTGLYGHFGKLRSALSNLNDRGALHIKNERKRALFSTLLVAANAVIRRVESDFAEPLPTGIASPLDAALRRRLEHAREMLKRNDEKLREDLARPTPTPAPQT